MPKRTTTKKVTKKGKQKKDSRAPKKAITGYMVFSKEYRPKLKTEEPNLTFGEIAKKIGSTWKDMSNDDKLHYQEEAEKDKERYKIEKEKYDKIIAQEKKNNKDEEDSDDDDDDDGKNESLSKSASPDDDDDDD